MIRSGRHLLIRFPNGQSPFGLAVQHADASHKPTLCGELIRLLIQDGHF
jgi:hypothetical protein